MPSRRAGLEPRRSSTGFRTYLFAVVLLVVTALVYLWGSVRTFAQREAIAAHQRERESLLRARDKLLADLAGQKQSSRIRARAESQGLVFPTDPPSNLYLSDTQVSTKP